MREIEGIKKPNLKQKPLYNVFIHSFYLIPKEYEKRQSFLPTTTCSHSHNPVYAFAKVILTFSYKSVFSLKEIGTHVLLIQLS